MKNIFYILSLALAFTAFTSCDDDDDTIISFAELPAKSQEFITTHFPNINVSRVEKDNDSYDVNLVNGFEIDFTLDGEWDNIDGHTQVIPASILALEPLNKMAEYVAINYPTSQIDEIDKDRQKNGYEIGLNNNPIELIFEWDGTFRTIDRD